MKTTIIACTYTREEIKPRQRTHNEIALSAIILFSRQLPANNEFHITAAWLPLSLSPSLRLTARI